MKKSCLVAVITVLAAVAGALAAVAVYLHRREKELDEYLRAHRQSAKGCAGAPFLLHRRSVS